MIKGTGYMRSFGRGVLWYYGIMVLWYYGIMVSFFKYVHVYRSSRAELGIVTFKTKNKVKAKSVTFTTFSILSILDNFSISLFLKKLSVFK